MQCKEYGNVHGFVNPEPYLSKAQTCIPAGYLAALEALSFGCRLKLFWADKVKEEYWESSPFMRKNLQSWAKIQTWDNLTKEYLNLWK
jgi:hypothetical protein